MVVASTYIVDVSLFPRFKDKEIKSGKRPFEITGFYAGRVSIKFVFNIHPCINGLKTVKTAKSGKSPVSLKF